MTTRDPVSRILLPVFMAAGLTVSQAQESSPSGEPVRPVGGPPWEMELLFADEFNGDTLDEKVWKSEEYGEKGIKNDTLRGPDNLEVRDGELRLHVRREDRSHKGKATQWTAGFVYTREPVEKNVYIEGRFKPGQSAGVNNAFWLACMTERGDTTRDKYELDIVETRKDVTAGKNTGRAHLAWHDWKTFGYARNAAGKIDHIAQGVHVAHSFDAYHTWGLWYGENETIFYLDGREMWRGKTHHHYKDQWWTGVGKFAQWFPDEEQRVYGKYGQDDWSYNAGYAGDRMNIIFSNIPWAEDWTPLSDDADGTWMAVDYVRVFKPKSLLAATPWQLATPEGQPPAIGTDSPIQEGRIALKPHGEATISLDPPAPTGGRWPHFFSLIVRKSEKTGLLLRFDEASGEEIFRAGVDAENALFAGFHEPASTSSALPAKTKIEPFFSEGADYLLVVRVTPGHSGERDAVSLAAFKLPMETTREPYFYPNIDKGGNTGLSNEWPINQKGRLAGSPASLIIENTGPGTVSIGPFRSGPNFRSILPPR